MVLCFAEKMLCTIIESIRPVHYDDEGAISLESTPIKIRILIGVDSRLGADMQWPVLVLVLVCKHGVKFIAIT